jgi:hypothetical protein
MKSGTISRVTEHEFVSTCNECRGVVTGTLLPIQEVTGLSFTLESVFLTGFLWFYSVPADKFLDIT